MRRARTSAAAFLAAGALCAAASGAAAADLDCLIEPHVVVQVASPVEALVETVRVDRGDVVKAGQVLATLESSVERATLAMTRHRAESDAAVRASEARLAYGARRLSRNEELRRDQIVSLSDQDEAETAKVLADIAVLEAHENRRLAQLETDRAQAALALRTIQSPVNGVVVERFLSPGEFAKQAPIVKVAQIDPLRVEVFAPVAMLDEVRVGMRAEVRPEAPVTGAYQARVTVVDRVVDAASGTFGVRLELPNPGHALPAGLRCTVRIGRPSASAR